MSSTARTQVRRGPSSSAQLGGTLRTIMIEPGRGFEAAFRGSEKRSRNGRRPAEGLAPYVIAALGGASGMALWLKIGAMAGVRNVASSEFRWEFLVASLAAGAIVVLIGQQLWGALGPSITASLGARGKPRDLRTVWGAAALPLVVALVALIPLDLVIVGSDSFTSERLADSISTGWAAISIALTVALAFWSAYLFIRGIQVTGRVGLGRAAAALLAAIALQAIVVAAIVVPAAVL